MSDRILRLHVEEAPTSEVRAVAYDSFRPGYVLCGKYIPGVSVVEQRRRVGAGRSISR